MGGGVGRQMAGGPGGQLEGVKRARGRRGLLKGPEGPVQVQTGSPGQHSAETLWSGGEGWCPFYAVARLFSRWGQNQVLLLGDILVIHLSS